MKKWKNWLSAGLLAVILGAGGSTVQTVQANAGAVLYERWDNVSPEESFIRGRAKQNSKAWQKIDGVCYNGSGVKIDGAVTRGIDVSEWQDEIDWGKAKQDIDFAFIRICYGANRIDLRYDENMTKAEAADVPVGTYVYSLAKSKKEAIKEAQVAISQMQGHKVSYPVVFDLEDEGTLGTCSPSEVSKIALAFCEEISKAGYTPMLYMNLNWYNNYVDWSLLEGSGLDVWIASYGDTILAPDSGRYRYTIWQSTAGDVIPGMLTTKKLISGIPVYNNVDLNFGFVDYTKKITPRWYAKADYVPTQTEKNGWATENGGRYYYQNGVKLKGWQNIDGSSYYFRKKDGYLYTNRVLKTTEGIYYVDKTGKRVKSCFVTWKKNTYCFSADGKAKTGMKKVSGRYYYFDPKTGIMQKNYKYMNSKGDIYYFGSNGYAVKNKTVTLNINGKKKTYYFTATGKAQKGWKTIGKKKYYFFNGKGPNAGVRAESVTLKSSKGIVSVFNKSGVCTKQYRA